MLETIDLAELLTVAPGADRATGDVFYGESHPNARGQSFGGQVMGQAAYATGLTVSESHQIHSLHGYFMRPGNPETPIRFDIERIFDGGTFATRRAQAHQNGQVIMSMIASHQRPVAGPEFYDTIDMSSVASPEQVPSLHDIYRHLADRADVASILNRPFEFRYLEGDIMVQVPERSSTQRVWVRSRKKLADNQLLHRAALVFVSDYLFIEPALRGFNKPWVTPGLKCASLDFAVWFHRHFSVNEWLLYELHTVSAGQGRALTQGRFFNSRGELVASASQEVMLRLATTGDQAPQ